MDARNCYVFFCNEIKKKENKQNNKTNKFCYFFEILASPLKYFFNRISSSKRQENYIISFLEKKQPYFGQSFTDKVKDREMRTKFSFSFFCTKTQNDYNLLIVLCVNGQTHT